MRFLVYWERFGSIVVDIFFVDSVLGEIGFFVGVNGIVFFMVIVFFLDVFGVGRILDIILS